MRNMLKGGRGACEKHAKKKGGGRVRNMKHTKKGGGGAYEKHAKKGGWVKNMPKRGGGE